jgi:predicted transcriptional regulator
MNETLTLPKTLAKRLDSHAARLGQSPKALLKTLIERELDYQHWLEKELDKADLEAENGELVSHEKVMADARALLMKHMSPAKAGAASLAGKRRRETA